MSEEALKADDLVERDIYECANQLEGYVGPNTEDHLAQFLLREGKAAAHLAGEIVRLRARIIAVEAERDANGLEAHQMRSDRDSQQRLAIKWLGLHDQQEARATKAEARIAVLEAALIKADLALCDWLNTYAPDLCSPVRVAEAEERIGSMGTIAYVAGTLQVIRAALTQEPS